ncbi:MULTISPECIES: DUF1330 domain-containing protein [unclassified Oceanobacter]|jgi:uncharacterized protein (DUF1330 family)|uniref:DUF1330 domain-containing protein n=1 Tax=unclassified Oceanobacter TaxID=2620260 RepID=UPI0026E11483|nr:MULTISPECIES: DUF1330 domain-containing protein [unclassified Oceanobacter]MDO6683098.1 DUF1330 domain-containing protein [Oceanobacter sp. 5_MG-2023]MDP2505905.1 DUF1330 domain-containing protein [Oceanobacter sp. 3_MG-2023]MDP2548365.1 DUF1330 domain-containing protein [Oceanobacter sp. 4_MG-2023]MDP2608383.1 DUF1330 domain-containing protein [Oceanobacter sp. 1_MG-2023]MDP2611478.1 DUF1330 domain-containing protein [Oceanobacter sp. 2_MG-2023]
MKAYWIAFVDIDDPRQYARYMEQSPTALQQYGARILARGSEMTALEGFDKTPDRAVVFEFDSYEQALACYHSDAYQQARQHRLEVASAHIVILKGQ